MSDSGPQGDPPPTVSHPPLVIPPCTTVATRKQTSSYGKLATGKTKEELLNHPTIYSSISTADQARKHLSERLLIQMNRDPNHLELSLALLNIVYSAPGILAIAADAICSVAILMDTLPTHLSASIPTQQLPIPPQLDTLAANLKAQVMSLMACITDIRETTDDNKTATVTLTRTIDEARSDLHNIAQVVNDSAEELSGIPSQIQDAIPASTPPLPHHDVHDTPYRDALEIRGPSLKIKALTQLRNGGFVIELSTLEVATWVRDPTRKLALTESLGGNVRIKDRTYNLLIAFVPVSTRVDDNSTWRSIEQANKIPCNSITQMKWIKDPSRCEGNQ
ncbi:hypothetical protein SCLCIDRAFT_32903 [Scleroderma citrinum Foug A]|uniref:Uncharacterized protein n=1 Tax=Scleroderma citrinum Foug A TaxID=1036808 RepID=A0A0C2ZH37_9AGAM|nr:hypothetical protein SCLCIDRAFT_32903 [Scleroderma citrinum Foug A]